MGVNVHRGTDIGVSEKFLHVLGCRPIRQEIARESVPKLVEAENETIPVEVENRT